ncbi:family 20 glycosylhydrolase, partial [Mycetocola reblochoni]
MSAAISPRPRHVAAADGALRLTGPLTVRAPERLDWAAADVAAFAQATAGVELRWVDGDGDGDGEPDVVLELVDGGDPSLGPAASGVEPRADASADERSVVVVAPAGARILAAHAEGLFRGLTTLLQLRLAHGEEGIPAQTVTDGPVYRWRGLSFDAVRCWYEIEVLERLVDLLAWHKLSVLHLHLSDVQAWRLPIPGWPRLTEGGAHYGTAQVEALIDYAARRFVTVVLEIDMPGHTHCAVAAYPELSGGRTAVHPFASFLDPDAEPVRALRRDVVAELVRLSPGPFVHVGGDEAFGMPGELYRRFVADAIAEVHAAGRRVIGWQETTRSAALTPDDAVQLWISPGDGVDAEAMKATTPAEFHPLVELVAESFLEAPGDVGRAAESAVPLIVSPTAPLYLDRKYAEASIVPEQNDRLARLGFPNYEPAPSTALCGW